MLEHRLRGHGNTSQTSVCSRLWGQIMTQQRRSEYYGITDYGVTNYCHSSVTKYDQIKKIFGIAARRANCDPHVGVASVVESSMGHGAQVAEGIPFPSGQLAW